MTTTAELTPALPKVRTALRLVALALMFLLGLFGGAILSGVDISDFRFVLCFLILVAVLSTVMDLARSLPAQNVVTVVALIAVFGSILELINASADSSTEGDVWFDALGPQWFGVFRWQTVLLWAINLLNSRSAARLILRPWSRVNNFGLLTFGLTVLLTSVSSLGIGYLAGMNSCLNFLLFAAVATVILLMVTPWLINKKPAPPPAPQYAPLLVWSMLVGILFSKWIP